MAALKQTLKKAKAEVADLTEEKTRLAGGKSLTEAELNIVRARLLGHQKSLTIFQTQISDLINEKTRLTDAKANTEAELAKARSLTTELQGSVKSLQAQVGDLTKEKNMLSDAKTATETELAANLRSSTLLCSMGYGALEEIDSEPSFNKPRVAEDKSETGMKGREDSAHGVKDQEVVYRVSELSSLVCGLAVTKQVRGNPPQVGSERHKMRRRVSTHGASDKTRFVGTPTPFASEGLGFTDRLTSLGGCSEL
ncbi:hypothetical protein R1sor_000135 [Riccia sorocarpa]|uniref:Uncharacterized protein n=1 Tax=Riccia sorocarpa TaxID=122646 RepID=A0ABD3GSB0_9MARC